MSYSKVALEQHRQHASAPPPPVAAPYDAEMDNGITLGCWNGERFVSWEKWRGSTPIDADTQQQPRLLPDAATYTAQCGGTRVWIVRDGDRWLMFAGSRKAGSRRRDFASPFRDHAMRTAEAWYGPADGGWRPDGAARKEEASNADPAE